MSVEGIDSDSPRQIAALLQSKYTPTVLSSSSAGEENSVFTQQRAISKDKLGINCADLVTKLQNNPKTYGNIRVSHNHFSYNTDDNYLQYQLTDSEVVAVDNLKTPVLLNIYLDDSGTIAQKISSNLAPKDLAVLLAINSSDNLPLLREIKEHLNLSDVSEQDIAEYKKREEEKTNEYNSIINRYTEGRKVANDKGELVPVDFSRRQSKDSVQSYEVLQGKYTIKQPDDKITSLQTFGVGPCVAVTLYDKKTKTGVLAHIDSTKKADSFTRVLTKLRNQELNLSDFEARIIGGWTYASEEQIGMLEDILNNNNIPIVELDVLGNNSRAVMLNLENGEVTDYNQTICTTPEEKLRLLYFKTLQPDSPLMEDKCE